MKIRYIESEESDAPIYTKKRKPKSIRGARAPKGSTLAAARIAAHSAFDNATWKTGKMTRSAAYRELSERLGIPKPECHIVNFDIEICERIIQIYETCSFDDLTKGESNGGQRGKSR